MADEMNGAWVSVAWNSVTLHVLGVTPPGFTRDDPVDNTHTGTGAVRAMKASPRYSIGELTVRAKFDEGVYSTLKGLSGEAVNVAVQKADLTVTYDSGATETYDDCYVQSVECDEVTEGSAPEMTIVFNQETI